MTNFDTIIQLEKMLLDSSIRKNQDELYELLHDDFMEFGTSGEIYNKKKIIDFIPQEDSNPIDGFNFKASMLSPKVIQLTYKTKKQNNDGTISSSLRSSIWKKNGKQWQMIFHQGTKTDHQVEE